MRRAALLLAASFFLAVPPLLSDHTAEDHLATDVPTVDEISYYLRQLQTTDSETRRMQSNKMIHDAIVHADLSDKREVRKIEKLLPKITAAITSGFDRPYIEGKSYWLASAINYFSKQKGRRKIGIGEDELQENQTESENKLKLSPFPDKILLLDGDKSQTLVEASGIHEAVISPNGRRVAYFREPGDREGAEIWTVEINKKRKPVKIADLPSCSTILFSLDGKHVFAQERTAGKGESRIWRMPARGGAPKEIGTAHLLDTAVKQGRYKGDIIIYKATPHHMGITEQFCPYAWDENGREIGRVQDLPCR